MVGFVSHTNAVIFSPIKHHQGKNRCEPKVLEHEKDRKISLVTARAQLMLSAQFPMSSAFLKLPWVLLLWKYLVFQQ